MTLVKPIISLFLLFLYIVVLGMFTIKVKFPDDTSIEYKGWVI